MVTPARPPVPPADPSACPARPLAVELAGAVAEDAARVLLEDARSERTLTYAGLRDVAAGWAAVVTPGQRILLDVDDPLDFAAAHLSLLLAGAISVPIDPDAPAADVSRTVRASQVSAVITDRSGRWAGSDLPLLAPAADPIHQLPGNGGVLLQTSGSTGDPKLIVLDEARLLHVARAVADRLELSATDRGFNPLPLFHINAQVVGLLATLVSGGTLVLDRRFRKTGFWDLITDRRITWINAVPAIWTILSRAELPEPIAGLRFVRSASAPLPVPIRELIAGRLAVPVVESYGMTEAASQITSTGLDRPPPPGSVGPAIGAEVEIRGEDGSPLPPGATGTVWIRGPGIITGYADGRGATRFDAGCWLDTGDLGRLDEAGNLFLAGRADDVINRGGELVYPREIEEILLADDRVSEAVVVAAPHDVLGQVPVAQLVLADGVTDVDALIAELEHRCAEQLSRFKRPASFAVVEEFPRASVGKIRRHLIRQSLQPSAGSR